MGSVTNRPDGLWTIAQQAVAQLPASKIKVYGGGVAEAEFLNELAQLVGEYRYSNMTRSRSKQGTSYSHDEDRKERTLDFSDLAAFPRGRAVVRLRRPRCPA